MFISALRGSFNRRFTRFSSNPSMGQVWNPSAEIESINVWAANAHDLWVTIRWLAFPLKRKKGRVNPIKKLKVRRTTVNNPKGSLL